MRALPERQEHVQPRPSIPPKKLITIFGCYGRKQMLPLKEGSVIHQILHFRH